MNIVFVVYINITTKVHVLTRTRTKDNIIGSSSKKPQVLTKLAKLTTASVLEQNVE